MLVAAHDLRAGASFGRPIYVPWSSRATPGRWRRSFRSGSSDGARPRTRGAGPARRAARARLGRVGGLGCCLHARRPGTTGTRRFLRPGDRVTVLATFDSGAGAQARAIARGLRVLTVGRAPEGLDRASASIPVTVALSNPSPRWPRAGEHGGRSTFFGRVGAAARRRSRRRASREARRLERLPVVLALTPWPSARSSICSSAVMPSSSRGRVPRRPTSSITSAGRRGGRDARLTGSLRPQPRTAPVLGPAAPASVSPGTPGSVRSYSRSASMRLSSRTTRRTRSSPRCGARRRKRQRSARPRSRRRCRGRSWRTTGRGVLAVIGSKAPGAAVRCLAGSARRRALDVRPRRPRCARRRVRSQAGRRSPTGLPTRAREGRGLGRRRSRRAARALAGRV